MKQEIRIIQIVITAIAVITATVHIIFPELSIDAITLTLVIIGIIPWLAPLFKSLEFPGGMKFEFSDKFEKLTNDLKKSNLQKESPINSLKYSFENIGINDAKLVLAGLRIEIEQTLRDIAISSGINADKKGVTQLIKELSHILILDENQQKTLIEITHLLNEVIHGKEISSIASEWALDVGPKLINALKFEGTNTDRLLHSIMGIFHTAGNFSNIEKASENLKCVDFIANKQNEVHHIRTCAMGLIPENINPFNTLQKFIGIMKKNQGDKNYIIYGCTESIFVDYMIKSIINNPDIRELFRKNPTFQVGIVLVDKNDYSIVEYKDNLLK